MSLSDWVASLFIYFTSVLASVLAEAEVWWMNIEKGFG